MDSTDISQHAAAPAPMHFRAHVWLERENTVLLGPGRALLLERIDQMGSLRKAAQSMNMSYRAAWGKIKKTEALLGQSLVEKTGHDRSGYSLTPYGKQLLRLFLDVQHHVNVEAARKAQVLEAQALATGTARAGGEG